MPESLVYLLLFLALLLPVIGAVGLRLLGDRLGTRGLALGGTVIFGAAIASALLLSRSDVGLLRIGDVSLLLPGTRQSDGFGLPPAVELPEELPNELPGLPELPTLTPRPSATRTATRTPVPSQTPTATAEPSPTPLPATATTEPPTPAPAGESRRYTVQAGDSLRGIAEQFGVSVEDLLAANDLSPAEADALRVGQELIIP